MPASVKRPAKAKSPPKDPKIKRKAAAAATASRKSVSAKPKAAAKPAAAKAAAGKSAKPAAKPSKKPAAKAASSKPVADKAAKSAPKKAATPKPATVKAAAPKPVAPKPVVPKQVEVKPVAVAPKPAAPAPAVHKPPVHKPQDSTLKIMPKIDKPAVVAEEDVDYAAGDYVVYPTHGVGRVLGIELQEVSGHKLRLIAIKFEKDRMTLRVPVAKAQQSGLRKLSTRKVMDSALAALKGKSRVKRTMWSRRAQEYEAKINSGDPVSIAEVVRDLHRGSDQPDQSYSERQMYQAALDRLAREFAAVEKIDEVTAAERLEQLLKAA